jgi:hypothetical protein
MLTPTEIYEKVTTHLLTQRAVSEDQNGSCRLHGAQGRKCAVGSLVSDESYKPAFEGIGISYYPNARDGDLLRALHASQVDAYRADIIDLLIELEQVHDDTAARVVRAGRSPRRPTSRIRGRPPTRSQQCRPNEQRDVEQIEPFALLKRWRRGRDRRIGRCHSSDFQENVLSHYACSK